MRRATSYAKTIRAFRLARGFSAVELSRRAGLCDSYIGSIERYARPFLPSITVERYIAKALGINPIILRLLDPRGDNVLLLGNNYGQRFRREGMRGPRRNYFRSGR